MACIWLLAVLGRAAGAAAARADDELNRQHHVALATARADSCVEDFERGRAELLHGLPDGRERRMKVAGDRHVVEAGNRNVLRHADTALTERVDHAQGGLVVRAQDGSWELQA